MKRFLKRALVGAALLPMVAMADAPDFTENLSIILSSQGTTWEDYAGLNFYLANPNDVTSAQARVRKKHLVPSGNYTVDVTIANRNPGACGAGMYTSTFGHTTNGAMTVGMSADGRNVVYSGRYNNGGNDHVYYASIDCGQSYVQLALPTTAPYTVIGMNGAESIRDFTESANGHFVYDTTGNSAYIAYNVYNPSDTNFATNTKLILARVSMPLKNITTYDLGNVRCTTNNTPGTGGVLGANSAGGRVRMAINDARQIMLVTDCGREFRTTPTGSIINNMPEAIIFNAATGTVQQRMSIGGLSPNLQSTRNGLVKAVATNGTDFFTLSDINGTAGTLNANLPRVKRWTEGTLGAGDFLVSNSNAGSTPFVNLSTTAANPYSDLLSVAAMDPIAAQYGAGIGGFDGVRLGSGFDGVDVVWAPIVVLSPPSLVAQGVRKTRITGLSATPSFSSSVITDYSSANFQALSPFMDAGIVSGNYFTFLGGAGLYAYQSRVVNLGGTQFPLFDAGLDAYDIE